MGLVNDLDSDVGFIRKSKRETAKEFLRKVTKETGGRVVFAGAKTEDVNAWVRELAAAQ